MESSLKHLRGKSHCFSIKPEVDVSTAFTFSIHFKFLLFDPWSVY